MANLYMRRFVVGWEQQGHEQRSDAHIVDYADDSVTCFEAGKAEEAMVAMRERRGKPDSKVNEKKTRRCSVPEETFTFLGFTFGQQISWKTGRAYVAPAPAEKKA